MTDAEIAGYMDWRGPGAYTNRQLVRIRRIVEEVRRREREAVLDLVDDYAKGNTDLRDAIRARGNT